ncbi:MAG: hypothetical protein AAGJ79_14400, partial [Verrucomicrobiota bacterium]
ITGGEDQTLVPVNGTVGPAKRILAPNGFQWIASSQRKFLLAACLAAVIFLGGLLGRLKGVLKGLGTITMLGGLAISIFGVFVALTSPAPFASGLKMSLPVVTPDEDVRIVVKSVSNAVTGASVPGLIVAVIGLLGFLLSFGAESGRRGFLQSCGVVMMAVGALLQVDGAVFFFVLVGVAVLLIHLVPAFGDVVKMGSGGPGSDNGGSAGEAGEKPGAGASGVAGCLVLLGFLLGSPSAVEGRSMAPPPLIPAGFLAADVIEQSMLVTEKVVEVSGRFVLSGEAGDQAILLKAPAVLQRFEGGGLMRVERTQVPGVGLCYVVHFSEANKGVVTLRADFSYSLKLENGAKSWPVPTGTAASNLVSAEYDKAGWEFQSAAAMLVESGVHKDKSAATLFLAPASGAVISLRPRSRDVASEETEFFVEGANLYTPGPGVVDGRHRVRVRVAQGEVSELEIKVPAGLTASEVKGPVGAWQFDAEGGVLKLVVEPAQSKVFDIHVTTQRALGTLPAGLEVSPLQVVKAKGEVGLLALAFGPEAQPERIESETLSPVNAGDFDPALLKGLAATLHQVFRYGAEGGTVRVRVAPVAPEIRVNSQQKLSFGDERIVIAVDFTAEITRSGVFSLSMPLPEGFEIESLTGSALHHWSELRESGLRKVVIRLNGKTLGAHRFSLVMAAPTPVEIAEWSVPRFEIAEASREEGRLIVVPTTGIRLRTLERKNVSETDPRKAGGTERGSLAYRLLQGDWSLKLGIEKLDPWITGKVLHDVMLREGQTKTTLYARFEVQNASIRKMRVVLPVQSEDELKTVRASGAQVSDYVRLEGGENLWEIQFSRRIIGEVQLQIDFERRGERAGVTSEPGGARVEVEKVEVVGFPDARQLTYHAALRAGGRLDLAVSGYPQGWRLAEWTAVAAPLREAGTRSAPVLTLRAESPEDVIRVEIRRHSLAESLKLRVSRSNIMTVLSPLGDQITEVNLEVEVIERSSLKVGLPEGGELFSVFVNGESVNAVREGEAVKFHILPGVDERTASVRFVYSLQGASLENLRLASPVLNVPLENIAWNLHVPAGFKLVSEDGDLELRKADRRAAVSREAYLSMSATKRKAGKEEADKLLDQAAKLALEGKQEKANWAFKNVANRSGLDAASNEDARVQLEYLQTQQAVIGLNTRRQRIYLDNAGDNELFATNEQLEEGAKMNNIIAKNDINFRPQDVSQLLMGNTSEENAVLRRIAGRIVAHQQSAEPAAQAIALTLPDEGNVYTFTRTVQVRDNAALQLEVTIDSRKRAAEQRFFLVILILGVIGLGLAMREASKRKVPQEVV